MIQLMEANRPKRRLKRTSNSAFLDAAYAWAKSPRASAARVWDRGRRGGGVRKDPQHQEALRGCRVSPCLPRRSRRGL